MRKYTYLVIVTGGVELLHHEIITGDCKDDMEAAVKNVLVKQEKDYLLEDCVTGAVLEKEDLEKDPYTFWDENAMEHGVDIMIIRDANVEDLGR
jgi:hypothetical protein